MKTLISLSFLFIFVQFNFAQNYTCKDLLKAVKENEFEQVVKLLQHVNPNCSYRGAGEPRSPLGAATQLGNLEMVKMLIDNNAKVKYNGDGDASALMIAGANGHLAIVKFLHQKGAKINRKIKGDGNALLVSARNGHTEVCKYLINNGAKVNAKVDGDGSALIMAIANDQLLCDQITFRKWRRSKFSGFQRWESFDACC